MSSFPAITQVAIAVTDSARSVQWYQQLWLNPEIELARPTSRRS